MCWVHTEEGNCPCCWPKCVKVGTPYRRWVTPSHLRGGTWRGGRPVPVRPTRKLLVELRLEGGFGMTPWCDDLVCSWRRLLADRHSLPFPWTLSLHRRWCPSASHHPLTFLFLLALTFPLPSPFPSLGLSLCRPPCPSASPHSFPSLSLGRLCQRSPRTCPVSLLCVESTQRKANAFAVGQVGGGGAEPEMLIWRQSTSRHSRRSTKAVVLAHHLCFSVAGRGTNTLKDPRHNNLQCSVFGQGIFHAGVPTVPRNITVSPSPPAHCPRLWSCSGGESQPKGVHHVVLPSCVV